MSKLNEMDSESSKIEEESEDQTKISNVGETLAQLQTRRNELVDKSHRMHERMSSLDKELDLLRAVLDEERSLKQSAVRRLAEKLCSPQCAKIGPFTSKGNIVYDRRIRQLKTQLDSDDLEMLKKRQMAIDMYNVQILTLDSTAARKSDEIRRLRVKLNMKQREIDDLRLGLEPKSIDGASESSQKIASDTK